MISKQMCKKPVQKKGDSDLFFLTCLSGLSPLRDNASRYFNINPREVRIFQSHRFSI